MDQFLKTFENFDNNLNLSIVLAILIVLVSIVFLWIAKRSSKKGNSLLIVGLSNSGKTTLFSQLVFKKSLLTQTSIIPNTRSNVSFGKTASSKDKRLDLIDIPGSDKVRRRFFDLHKKSATGLIFVVESSTFQQNQKDVAQYLFEVLTDEFLAKSSLNILIVCNKQDHDFAKSETLIRTTLEKEIELLRKISASALKSTNESKNSSSLLYTKQKDASFEFNNLKYLKVDFSETTATEKSSVEKTVVNWIQTKL